MIWIPTPEEIDRELSGRDFFHFVKSMRPEYRANWHHEAAAKELQRLYHGDIDRLMLNMPPGHAKSEYASRFFPAWCFGKNPDLKFVGASYGATLAELMSRDVQRIMDEDHFKPIFPDAALEGSNVRTVANGKALRNAEMFEIVGRSGAYKCAGVDGPLTGFRADIGSLDDPYKGPKEANSPTVRENTWQWYNKVFKSRLRKKGRICITMTRWHEADIAGRLLKEEGRVEDGGRWTVVNFPAILDDEKYRNKYDKRKLGEALWPSEYPLDFLLEMKKSDPRGFEALYQQRPTAQEGSIIKRQWLSKFYRELPATFDKIIQSWDFTFKDTSKSDFVCGTVWGKKGGEYWLLDRVRGRMGFIESKAAVKSLSAKHPRALRKLIEDKANGPAIIESLKHDISGIIPVNPTDSKEARAHAISPLFEAGNVHLPDPSIAPWIHEYIEELVGFPHGANDDQLDSTSQALLDLSDRKANYLSQITRM